MGSGLVLALCHGCGDGSWAGFFLAAVWIDAIKSNQNNWQPSGCQFSSCTRSTALTRRVIAVSLKAIPNSRAATLDSIVPTILCEMYTRLIDSI